MRMFVRASADRDIAVDKLHTSNKLIKVGCHTSGGNFKRRISIMDIQEVDLVWEHHLNNLVNSDTRKGDKGPDEPDWNACMEKILNDLRVGSEDTNGPLCFRHWRKFPDYPQGNDLVKLKEHLKLQHLSLKLGDSEMNTPATYRDAFYMNHGVTQASG